MSDSEKTAVRSCSVYEPDFVLEGLYFDNGKNNFNRLPEGTYISERVQDLATNPENVWVYDGSDLPVLWFEST